MDLQAGQVWKENRTGRRYVLTHVGTPTVNGNLRNHLLVEIGKKGLMLAANAENMIGANYETFTTRFTPVGMYPNFKQHYHTRGRLHPISIGKQKNFGFMAEEPEEKLKTSKMYYAGTDKDLQLRNDLEQFTGSEKIYKHPISGMLYTEGIKYLADKAQAYWLIDAIASYQQKFRSKEFQIWTFKLDNKGGGILQMQEDIPGTAIVTQHIQHTDFPLHTIKLYLENNTLTLPRER